MVWIVTSPSLADGSPVLPGRMVTCAIGCLALRG